MNDIILLIVLILLLLILRINKIVIKTDYKIFNPVSVLVYVWILVFVSHFMYFEFSEHTMWVYFLVSLGILSLSIGFWLTSKQVTSNKSDNTDYNPLFLKKIMNGLVVVEIIRLCYFYYVIVAVLAGGVWMMLFSEGTLLRNSYLSYQESIPEKLFSFISNLTGYIGYAIIGVYVAKNYTKRWVYFIVISIIELAIAVITMSKLAFSLYLLSFIISYLNNLKSLKEQKRMIKKKLPFVGVCLFCFFFFIGFQRNYMDTRGSLSDGVIDGIVDYFAGPLQALTVILEKDIPEGAIDWIDIGRTETNVYTWFIYFHYMIPYLGVIIIPFLFGIVAGRLYKPWRHNLFFDVSNTWICSIFAFSFFDQLLKFTIFQVLFFAVYFINYKFSRKLYIWKR